MNKIKEIRKVRCAETWSRYWPREEMVNLFVAEMRDGTRFYTTVGGTHIFGTDEEITSKTDISNIHDFQTIVVPGGVSTEEEFINAVEKDAVVDDAPLMNDEDIKKQYSGMKIKHFHLEHLTHSEGWKGTFELDFPNADGIDYDTSMVNGFIVYDYKGERIAWDNWMPDDQTHQLEDVIRKEIKERLERQSAE